METILERIINEKRREVSLLKEDGNFLKSNFPDKRSFLKKLQHAEKLAVIAEFKRASPSKGLINGKVEPLTQALLYESSGASAISVLTDRTFFKGSFEDLKMVRGNVEIPVLCKDFIIDRVQIEYAASNGADMILLIAAALDTPQLNDLHQFATELGLEVLLEVHNQEELEKAFKVDAKLIGINNRDLKTFQVSLEVTENLGPLVKSFGAYLISESGIFTKSDAQRVSDSGADGILVGEALMKSENIKKKMEDLKSPLLRVTKR